MLIHSMSVNITISSLGDKYHIVTQILMIVNYFLFSLVRQVIKRFYS